MTVSIAIPDSSLEDEHRHVDKTRKISLMGRTCAIFGIDTVYIYKDTGTRDDQTLLSTILRYMETPQFLRRFAFPKINDLKYAGVLSPLQTPHHTVTSDVRKIKKNDIRDGLVLNTKNEKFIDVGFGTKITYRGKQPTGKRILVQFTSEYPTLAIREVDPSQYSEFRGYAVKERNSLYALLTEWTGKIILTSRKGKLATPNMLRAYHDSNLLIVFGSTSRGIHDMLGSRLDHIQNSRILNFFPNQHTKTVRLEEALLGILSIINAA